jgi:hypothetical protein
MVTEPNRGAFERSVGFKTTRHSRIVDDLKTTSWRHRLRAIPDGTFLDAEYASIDVARKGQR